MTLGAAPMISMCPRLAATEFTSTKAEATPALLAGVRPPRQQEQRAQQDPAADPGQSRKEAHPSLRRSSREVIPRHATASRSVSRSCVSRLRPGANSGPYLGSVATRFIRRRGSRPATRGLGHTGQQRASTAEARDKADTRPEAADQSGVLIEHARTAPCRPVGRRRWPCSRSRRSSRPCRCRCRPG